MSSRSDQPTSDPLVLRFLGAVILMAAFTLLALELYLGKLLVGGHVVGMIILGATAWTMFVPVLRKILDTDQ